MIRYVLFASLVLSACSLSGSPKAQAPAKELNLYLQTDSSSLDPRIGCDCQSVLLIRELFEGLVRIGGNGDPELALASSYTLSDDGTVYTFHLRPATWSNDTPVTANDFVFAWKSMLDNSIPSAGAYALSIIKNARKAQLNQCSLDEVGIKAIDPSTLEVTLENPAPYFFELLALPLFSPVCQAAVEKNPEWANSSFPDYVCNGPFILKERKPKSLLTLEKNPHYLGTGPAKTDTMRFSIISDPQVAYKMFQEGSLDWYGETFGSVTLDTVSELAQKGDLVKRPSGGSQWLLCNVKTPHLSSVKIRKALACAINRQELCDKVLQGGEAPSYSVVLRSMSQLKERPFDYNPTLARQLLDEGMAELGYTRETFPPITITHLSEPIVKAIVEAEQQQIQNALGITIDLGPVDWGTYIKLVSSSDESQGASLYQLMSLYWFTFYQDPIHNLEDAKYRGLGANTMGWESSRYIALLDQADNTVDPQMRSFYLQQAEQLLMDELPIIPVFYHTFKYVKAPRLTGEAISGAGQVELRWLEKSSVG